MISYATPCGQVPRTPLEKGPKLMIWNPREFPFGNDSNEKGPVLLAVTPPKTGEHTLLGVENLLQSIAVPEPFSLKLVGNAGGMTLMARCIDDQVVPGQLSAHYTRARIRKVDVDDDALRQEEGERVVSGLLLRSLAPYPPPEERCSANSSPVTNGCRRENASCLKVSVATFLTSYPGSCCVYRECLSSADVGQLVLPTTSRCMYYGLSVRYSVRILGSPSNAPPLDSRAVAKEEQPGIAGGTSMETATRLARNVKNWLKCRPRLEIEESATWFLLLFAYSHGLSAESLGFKVDGMIPQLTAPQMTLGMALLCLGVSVLVLIEPLLPQRIRELTTDARRSPSGQILRGTSVFFAFLLGMTAGVNLLVDKVPTLSWLIGSVFYVGFLIFVVMEIKLISLIFTGRNAARG